MTIFVNAMTLTAMKPNKCLNVIAEGVQFEEGVAVSKEVDVSLDKECAKILHQWLGIYLDVDNQPPQEIEEEPKYVIHVAQEGVDSDMTYINYMSCNGRYHFGTSLPTHTHQTQFTQAEIDASSFLKKLEGFKIEV